MSLSDIVLSLSHFTPLEALGVYTSKIINVGAYRTLQYTIKASSKTKFTILFSHSGAPNTFDVFETYDVYRAGVFYKSFKPPSLWCKIELENTKNEAQTFLRCSCYASSEDVSLEDYKSVNDHFFDVNSDQNFITTQPTSEINNTFFTANNITTQSLINLHTPLPYSPYHLKAVTDVTNLSDFRYSSTGFFSLYTPSENGKFSRISSNIVYPQCRAKSYTFQCFWHYGELVHRSLIGFGVPLTVTSKAFESGVFLFSGGSHLFGISIWDKGVETVIPNTNFNLNTLTGDKDHLWLDPHYLNTYKIDVSSLGDITFYFYNRYTRKFIPFHSTLAHGSDIYTSAAVNFNQAFFTMQMENLGATNLDYLAVNSYNVNLYTPFSRLQELTYSESRTITSTEANIIALKNLDKPYNVPITGLFYPSCIKLKTIDIINSSTNVIYFNIYRDCVLNPVPLFFKIPNSNLGHISPVGTITSSVPPVLRFYMPPNKTKTFPLNIDIAFNEIITISAVELTNNISGLIYWTINYNEYF